MKHDEVDGADGGGGPEADLPPASRGNLPAAAKVGANLADRFDHVGVFDDQPLVAVEVRRQGQTAALLRQVADPGERPVRDRQVVIVDDDQRGVAEFHDHAPRTRRFPVEITRRRLQPFILRQRRHQNAAPISAPSASANPPASACSSWARCCARLTAARLSIRVVSATAASRGWVMKAWEKAVDAATTGR